jgi:glycosyltransferase involved in cell wall biosynthesis
MSHPIAPSCPATVIGNAVSDDFFFPAPVDKPFKKTGKIRIIATSWSNNPQKGYPTYAWLDENLDFTKYSFTVVGKTDYQFKNIEIREPVEQRVLGDILRDHDIYITASKIESCSNALLEALQCGLPCIAPNCSSHPEYVSNHDLLFDTKEEILTILQDLSENLDAYRLQINVATMEEIAAKYVEFSRSLPAARAVNSKELKLYLQENEFIPSGIGAVKQSIKALGRGIFRRG